MSSPAADPPPSEDWAPEYSRPAWYTNPLSATSAGSGDPPIPWYSVGTGTPTEPGCHICQAQPAVSTTVTAHIGLAFWSRTRTVAEPLCRQCGIALVRIMTTRTLWQGWWGVLSALYRTPQVLAHNAAAHRQFRALPTSEPPPGRTSLALGKPVWGRPQAYAALLPVAGALAIATSVITSRT
ncbi:hypothetical protein ACFYPC_34020 [Streptomyces sp. NPDC005808]|uniref:hypothetical protein n=1 Tax=Streptomyces sp. NPDC005808 TaxID=3364734 RepID=UPI0036828F46